jgi:exopolysaccharide biosynthesis polyprenyl glycosylphosphotransferase
MQVPSSRSPMVSAGLLVLADALAFAGLWLLAWRLRLEWGHSTGRPINDIGPYLRALPILLPIWLLTTAYGRHYQLRHRIDSLNQFGAILRTAVMIWIGTMAAAYLLRGFSLGRSVIFLGAFLMLIYLWGSRTWLRSWKRSQAARGAGVIRVAIVGWGEPGRATAGHLRAHPDIAYEFVGWVLPGDEAAGTDLAGKPILGAPGRLEAIIREHRLDEVVLAAPSMKADEALALIDACEKAAADFRFVTQDFLHVVQSWLKVDEIGDHSVMLIRNDALPPVSVFVKRVMDLAVAVPLAVLVLPFAAAIALAIRLDSSGPALFTHERVGRGGRRFRILKFRTMSADADPYAPGPESIDDPRITRVGRWLRRTSLDELPQLINVIKGEMSLVGPRPEMPFIVEQYSPWQRRRLDVPQGITGLWQIAGRKRLPLQHSMEYDFYYIRNRTIFLDLAILLRTFSAVVFGRGAY